MGRAEGYHAAGLLGKSSAIPLLMGWLCAGLVRSVPKCFRIQHAARCWEEWLWKDAALRGRSKHSSISAVPLAPLPTVCFDFLVVSRYPSTWVKSKWSHQTGLCCWLPSLIVSVVLLCMPSSCPLAALFHLCIKNSSLVLGCSEINRALSAFFCVHQKRILRVLHPSNSASWEFCKQGVRLKADVPGTKSERASYITASKGADSAANQGLSRWYLTFFFFNVSTNMLHCKDSEKYIQGSQRWQGKAHARQGLLQSSTSQACRKMQQGAVLLQWVTAQEGLWAGRCPESHPCALSIPSGLQWAHEFGVRVKQRARHSAHSSV